MPHKAVLSKRVPCLFQASRCFVYEQRLQYTAFENLDEIKVAILPYWAIFYTVSQLQLRCQLTTCINRKYVFCDIHFFKNYFELLIMGLVLKSGFPVTVTQDSIDSILSFLQALTLYSF